MKKADELTKDGAEMDGGALAAAKASTIKQLTDEIYASMEAEAHRVQVAEWKDRDVTVPKEKEMWQFVWKKRRQETQDRTMQGLGRIIQVYEMWKEKQYG